MYIILSAEGANSHLRYKTDKGRRGNNSQTDRLPVHSIEPHHTVPQQLCSCYTI